MTRTSQSLLTATAIMVVAVTLILLYFVHWDGDSGAARVTEAHAEHRTSVAAPTSNPARPADRREQLEVTSPPPTRSGLPESSILLPAEEGARLLVDLPAEQAQNVTQEYDSYVGILEKSGRSHEAWAEQAKGALSRLIETTDQDSLSIDEIRCFASGCIADISYPDSHTASSMLEPILQYLDSNWPASHIITGTREPERGERSSNAVILVRPPVE